jgi:hypothetical protein
MYTHIHIRCYGNPDVRRWLLSGTCNIIWNCPGSKKSWGAAPCNPADAHSNKVEGTPHDRGEGEKGYQGRSFHHPGTKESVLQDDRCHWTEKHFPCDVLHRPGECMAAGCFTSIALMLWIPLMSPMSTCIIVISLKSIVLKYQA